MASMSWTFALVVLLTLCCLTTVFACPPECMCKWKGGKQTVECRNKGLIAIQENIDSETQVLDMTGNNFQILPRDTFVRAGLLNLQKVYLRSCRIGQVDDRAFRGLTNLVELDLSENLLTSIPSPSFLDVPLLRDLWLSENPIQKVEAGAFKHVPGLVKLDMSNSELQTISPRAFDGLTSLETLKINGNQLTEVPHETVETLNKLHNVQLHDNPWECDCRMRPAKRWIEKNNVPYLVEPSCGGPPRLAGRLFAELFLDEFACRPEILPGPRRIDSVIGENATLACRVSGVPTAAVGWYWSGRPVSNNTLLGLGTAASSQRVVIREFSSGVREGDKTSMLVLVGAQIAEWGEFYCVAQNKAGVSEANFTLNILLHAAGAASLGSGQIAGLSAALVVLILCILLIILFLLMRLRRLPFLGFKDTTTELTKIPSDTSATVNSTKSPAIAEIRSPPNPVQKPPRLTEMAYTTTHYNGGGSVMVGATTNPNNPNNNNNVNGSGGNGNRVFPNNNNPDLIPSETAAPQVNTANTTLEETNTDNNNSAVPNGHINNDFCGGDNLSTSSSLNAVCRSRSGEYNRVQGDSLYPWGGSSGVSVSPMPSSSTDIHDLSSDSVGFGSSETGPNANSVWRGTANPLDPTLYGYPPDYGLPIPEATTTPDMVNQSGGQQQQQQPPSAIALRVWQKGVPVLPPVTALKRVLARDSPDEGYQEGCGTDV